MTAVLKSFLTCSSPWTRVPKGACLKIGNRSRCAVKASYFAYILHYWGLSNDTKVSDQEMIVLTVLYILYLPSIAVKVHVWEWLWWSSLKKNLLACGARGPWFEHGCRHFDFRDRVSSGPKSRYDWNTVNAT